MQRSEWRTRIRDMLEVIVEIQAFTKGLDLDEFRSDTKTLRAVQYDFIVLGEAARSIPDDIQMRLSSLPWRQIIGMRNLVAHRYRRVDPVVLWDTIQNDLPPLVSMLRGVLEAEA